MAEQDESEMPADGEAEAKRPKDDRAERRAARQLLRGAKKPIPEPDREVRARKIFVISFQKTGTTTMTAALRALGLLVGQATIAINERLKAGEFSREEMDEIVHATAFEVADRSDAAQDSPYPLIFRELDARYPGSKFIYLERAPDAWVKSVVGHFGKSRTYLREWIYGEGSPVGAEEIYRQRFVDHRQQVLDHFANRPDDLLTMSLSAGDGWLKLVDFLGPDFLPPFPHKNRRA